jgi:hypothetical protein
MQREEMNSRDWGRRADRDRDDSRVGESANRAALRGARSLRVRVNC